MTRTSRGHFPRLPDEIYRPPEADKLPASFGVRVTRVKPTVVGVHTLVTLRRHLLPFNPPASAPSDSASVREV